MIILTWLLLWCLLPGCFFFVGAALPGPVRPHHQAVFDFDEVRIGYTKLSKAFRFLLLLLRHSQRALLISASVLVQIVRDELRRE
jgi:hypothetical protein